MRSREGSLREGSRRGDGFPPPHPELTTDEQRFQRARALNIARFQQQVFGELLPAVFGPREVARHVGPYRGYDPGLDPRLSTTFDIALRVGHSQVLLPPLIFDGAESR